MIGGGRRRMRHHQAVPCSMVVAVERWSGRHRRRRGGRCFCSAASSAEKRGVRGRPPTPPAPSGGRCAGHAPQGGWCGQASDLVGRARASDDSRRRPRTK